MNAQTVKTVAYTKVLHNDERTVQMFTIKRLVCLKDLGTQKAVISRVCTENKEPEYVMTR